MYALGLGVIERDLIIRGEFESRRMSQGVRSHETTGCQDSRKQTGQQNVNGIPHEIEGRKLTDTRGVPIRPSTSSIALPTTTDRLVWDAAPSPHWNGSLK